MSRITSHPIVRREERRSISLTFAGKAVSAYEGEMLSSALYAAGVRIFGHHPKDGAPQGLFCANGQCSQCMVLADGFPVKACMTPARAGMSVQPLDGLPELPPLDRVGRLTEIEHIETSVLILGGGPAGLSAAVELGRRGVQVLLVDDKDRLGGKLVLQTHRFFGSIEAVHAGTRGIDIGARLEAEVRGLDAVRVWLNSTALAVFADHQVGVLHRGRYALVRPEVLLVATGAREKSLAFRGNTLPGVYGAGAFQTLVNRDLVRAAERLFIIGGGNVGLIAGYHALQAGIDVVGVVEALPECGGYKVHRDKLARLGVPIYTSHTILSANGTEGVESVTMARLDRDFRQVPGTERSFACDTVLIAVGLDPVDEFYRSAMEFGLPAFAAGDAEEIAEASAAIFSGKIKGLEIARSLGVSEEAVPLDWRATGEILKSKPGLVAARSPINVQKGSIRPVFHCSQEIPCNPCTSVCPRGLIRIEGGTIRGLPEFIPADAEETCIGCERCVVICPGLAITLVDRRGDGPPIVTLPFEFGPERLSVGDSVDILDDVGNPLGEASVVDLRPLARNDRTALVKLLVSEEKADRVAGIRVQEPWVGESLPETIEPLCDDSIICRCERVTAGEIRKRIREGYRDMNEIKTVTRAGMGACGGKTCTALILRLFREEGVPVSEVVEGTRRPLFVEVPFGVFAGVIGEDDERLGDG
jgi:sarcosine oxidase subunit alpha